MVRDNPNLKIPSRRKVNYQSDDEIKSRNLVVYLLSRNDLSSMTAGKELAQAQHAGVQMAAKYHNHKDVKEYLANGIRDGADHFNTTVTLETDHFMIRDIVQLAQKLGYAADFVNDPTYPFVVDYEIARVYNIPWVKSLDDNKVMATRPELTLGWLLGNKEDPNFTKLVEGLELKSHNKLIYAEK